MLLEEIKERLFECIGEEEEASLFKNYYIDFMRDGELHQLNVEPIFQEKSYVYEISPVPETEEFKFKEFKRIYAKSYWIFFKELNLTLPNSAIIQLTSVENVLELATIIQENILQPLNPDNLEEPAKIDVATINPIEIVVPIQTQGEIEEEATREAVEYLNKIVGKSPTAASLSWVQQMGRHTRRQGK